MTKKHFDDRSQTSISVSIQNHKRLRKVDDALPLQTESILNWNDTNKIYRFVNSPEFIINYGSISFMEPCAIYISIGTNKGYVHVFNYHQELEFVLDPTQSASNDHYLKDLSVTCMSFSADFSFLAAGYINGLIIIWELKNKSHVNGIDLTSDFDTIDQDELVIDKDNQLHPYFIIHPITLEDRFNKNKEGHLNVTINCIKFCHTNFQLISTDVSGLIFYHHGIKRLLTRVFITQKLLGKNDANAIPKDTNSLFNIEILPYGNTPQITDLLCVVAIITGSNLFILSILSLNDPTNLLLKSHFKNHKPKTLPLASDSYPMPSLDWFPCMKIGLKELVNSRLAYAWNNCITIVELENNILPPNLLEIIEDLKDKDKNIPNLPVTKTVRHYLPNDVNITSLKWVSNSLLHVFTKDHIFIVYYDKFKKIQILTQEPVLFKLQPLQLKFNKSLVLCNNSYNNCIKVIRNRIILLTKDLGSNDKMQIMIGKSISWADKLIDLLKKERFHDALILVNFFYNSTSNHLVLYSLPEDDKSRKILVYPYLIKILKEAIPKMDFSKFELTQIFLINFNEHDNGDDSDTILELLYEQVEFEIFFQNIEPFLLSNYINRLPPVILKGLVNYYATIGRGDILTEILCTIDITTLDIDLTISICKQYELTDCLIFIWNYLLSDYRTPFIEYLDKIRADPSDSRNLNVFNYLSYILTGRQYPIDKYIDFDKEYDAKLQILQVLFSQNNIVDSIFPNLTILLKYNSFEMLSTLNEFFEDSILNDDDDDDVGDEFQVKNSSVITRQYIIEALLDIYGSNEFGNTDKCHLSIFIGRNYPKYSQFIRLSDSILNQILENLLNFNHKSIKSDCELAVQSLLSVFEPFDENKLIEKLNFAEFYNVLINIYKVNGKYDKYLKLYLEVNKNDHEREREQVSLVLQECFNNSRFGANKINLISVIKENFVKLVNCDLPSFILEINKFDKPIHKELLKYGNDTELQYKYLQTLFSYEIQETYLNSSLILRYIELLCEFNESSVYPTVSKFYLFIEKNELKMLEKILKDHDQISSLTIPLNAEGNYQKSLDELLNNFEKTPVLEDDINLYIKILESEGFYHQYQKPEEETERKEESEGNEQGNGLNLNEKYWLELISKLIELSSHKDDDSINRFIYMSFKRISDIKLNPQDKNESSFLKIFNTFLANNDSTLLINIKNILIDILISYSYESEILRLGSKNLNHIIFDKLKLIKANNIKGWSINCKYCTNCNKKLYGSNIDIRNSIAWENKQMTKLNLFCVDDDPDNLNDLRLVFFKCNHGYHHQCLKNLNSNQCVICSQ